MTTDYRKQLKQHLDEAKRLEAELPALRQEQQAAQTSLRLPSLGLGQTTQHMNRAESALHDAETALARHRREAEHLERILRDSEARKQAPATLKAAGKTASALSNDLAKLQRQHESLAGKQEKLRTEARQALEHAERTESEAAESYAKAMALGDEAAEQQALKRLEAASETLDKARSRDDRQQAIIAALTKELEALEARQQEARATLAEAEQEQNHAAYLILTDQWDKAARQLIELGARIAMAERRLYGRTRAAELSLPLFAKEGPESIRVGSEMAALEGLGPLELVA